MIIRFRAWDKKEKRWCYETEVNIEASTPSSPAGPTYWHLHHDAGGNEVKMLGCPDIEVSLSTGLFDKKGKEIFQGDIVRCFEDFVQPVEWRDGGFGYDVCGDLVYFGHNIYFNWKDGQSKEIEVLGNIWENPRLIEELKAEKKE